MISILITEGGDQIPPAARSEDRRLTFLHIAAGYETFFGDPQPIINRSFRLCLDHRKPRAICVW
ncbi:hypothetical protein C2U51_05910 [Enterobacteriaceae bacterium ENNIH1]|nr:hypothetical protein C2U51_05910 [Enterobacteriaceae bacterium ENNIH1]